jgi:hypothetical protein
VDYILGSSAEFVGSYGLKTDSVQPMRRAKRSG